MADKEPGTREDFHKAFCVQTVGTHTFVQGWDEKENAQTDATNRNDKAKKLGFKARYEAVDNPNKW